MLSRTIYQQSTKLKRINRHNVTQAIKFDMSRSVKGKGKSVPQQARCGPEGSRRFRIPDFHDNSAHEGGEVVSLTHRPPLPQEMFLVLIFTRG